jgi:archaemetzincin
MLEIKIIPLGNIERKISEAVAQALEETYGAKTRITPSIKIPEEALNKLRGQYKASIILEYICKNFEGRILAVVNEDIYAEGLNFIFGQAQVNGKVCIISLHRLDPRFYKEKENISLLIERTQKEAVHEVGHTLGLSHCKNPECVMCFSNTVWDVDKKSKKLCDECRTKLDIKFISQS